MKRSSRILTTILGAGMVYSFYKLFTGSGGSGLEEFYEGLGYTSLLLFTVSLVVLLINIRQVEKHSSAVLFLLLGLPLTIIAAGNFIKHERLTKEPDIRVKYNRPVDGLSYLNDSLNIKIAIDSAVALYNRQTGGPKKLFAFIDTIIYSQRGDKVFISYAEKFAPNNLGNDLSPSFLYAVSRDSGLWNLQTANYNLSGSYPDTASLKKAVRRFYFNRFSFLDKDSLDENFFWRRIVYPGG